MNFETFAGLWTSGRMQKDKIPSKNRENRAINGFLKACDSGGIWFFDAYASRSVFRLSEFSHLCIASHIIPWAENTKTRMDPRNGLCLSATYDKAFDNYLITFDEDYRLVVSKEIRDHYRNEHARELFEKREGQVIILPQDTKRYPLQEYLAVHRESLET